MTEEIELKGETEQISLHKSIEQTRVDIATAKNRVSMINSELEKVTGYLTIDRPQKFSNICPSLYGLIPQTLCGEKTAEFCASKTGRSEMVGDDDPLDICVLTEKPIGHGDILLDAIPIGGLRMIDGNEADDKIMAVLKDDAVYGDMTSIHDCPDKVIQRLVHYFQTYKDDPNMDHTEVEITHIYDREEALVIIEKTREDYKAQFGALEDLLTAAFVS